MSMVHARSARLSGENLLIRTFSYQRLILAGDLNFTLNIDEIWGTTTVLDPLAPFFKELFDDYPLVDVAPTELVPTWRNGRIGESSISKRLDRFYMHEDLMGPELRYRSWVEPTYISDHSPILLQLDLGIPKTRHSFKFNPVWLKDGTFVDLTREVWLDQRFDLIVGSQRRLVEKLSLLKNRVKSWLKEKLKREHEQLTNLN
jgi:hypothetical protein